MFTRSSTLIENFYPSFLPGVTLEMAPVLILVLSASVAAALFLIWQVIVSRRRASDSTVVLDNEKQPQPDPYEDIEPLNGFDWSTETPIKIRPFKPKYHLTMGEP